MDGRHRWRVVLLTVLVLACLVVAVQGIRTGEWPAYMGGLVVVVLFGTWETVATIRRVKKKAHHGDPWSERASDAAVSHGAKIGD